MASWKINAVKNGEKKDKEKPRFLNPQNNMTHEINPKMSLKNSKDVFPENETQKMESLKSY